MYFINLWCYDCRWDNGYNYGDNFHTYIFDWSTNGLRYDKIAARYSS